MILVIETGEACEGFPLFYWSERMSEISAYLKNKYVVYLTGYLGAAKEEFSDGEKALKEMAPGVPVIKIETPTEASVENNLPVLIRKLAEIGRAQSGRLGILIGHSKGGAETVLLAVSHPEVFTSLTHGFQLDRAVVIQGAVGGSVMADLGESGDPEMSAKWQAHVAKRGWFENAIKGLLRGIFLKGDSDGFKSLSRPMCRERNEKLANGLSSESRELLGKRLLYLTSQRESHADDMPLILKSVAKFMAEQAEPNDGLVFVSDQFYAGFGKRLMHVERAGHFSLTGSEDKSFDRAGFVRELFTKLAAE